MAGLFDFGFEDVFDFDYDYRKKRARSNQQNISRSYTLPNPGATIEEASSSIGEYDGSFEDMDIFGRYSDADLDMFCRPRNGRLLYSTTYFP